MKNPERVAAAKSLFKQAAEVAHTAACAHRDAASPEEKERTRLAYVAALDEETKAYQVLMKAVTNAPY